MHRQHRLEVLDDVGVQAAHDAEFVGHVAKMRKELADPQARFAVLRERNGEAIRGSMSLDLRRWTAETLLPCVDRSRGLGSNVSTCENPPVRKTKIRCLARAG